MDEEIKRYDKVFEEIMNQLNIEVEVWKNSTDFYFQSHGMMQSESYDIEREMHNIEEVEKRMYEYLPAPDIPKSLTKQKTKNILINVNQQANAVYKKNIHIIPEDHIEQEPLIIEAFAQDLACMEYEI